MTATWLDRFGICQAPLCARVAVGILRDERNGEIGRFCNKCAQTRLNAARDAALKGDQL